MLREIADEFTSRSRKASVALLHYSTPPVAGGVELMVERQAGWLRECGHDVAVITGRGNGILVNELDSQHPRVMAVTRGLASGAGYTYEFQTLRDGLATRLQPLLRDKDVVIAHNVMTMPYNVALAAALIKVATNLVAWTHDIVPMSGPYSAFRSNVDRYPYNVVCTRQAAVDYVTISRVRLHDLGSLWATETTGVSIVPNAVDYCDVADSGHGAARLLETFDAANAEPLILVPQRVTADKRTEIVLGVASDLHRQMPRLRIIVTGPLDPHAWERSKYGDNLLAMRNRLGLESVVRFLFEFNPTSDEFWLPRHELLQLYRLSDVVLLTERDPGFCLAALEAGLARVPVVCSDHPVFREILGSSAHTFPQDGDVSDAAASVRVALERRAAPTRHELLERFSWTGAVQQTETVIEEIRRRRVRRRELDPSRQRPSSGHVR